MSSNFRPYAKNIKVAFVFFLLLLLLLLLRGTVFFPSMWLFVFRVSRQIETFPETPSHVTLSRHMHYTLWHICFGSGQKRSAAATRTQKTNTETPRTTEKKSVCDTWTTTTTTSAADIERLRVTCVRAARELWKVCCAAIAGACNCFGQLLRCVYVSFVNHGWRVMQVTGKQSCVKGEHMRSVV